MAFKKTNEAVKRNSGKVGSVENYWGFCSQV